MKAKRLPLNYRKLAVRIVRLIILLVSVPLYFVAMMEAYVYARPVIFFGMFLFLLAHILIALFSYVAAMTPFELMAGVAKGLWELANTREKSE